MELNKECVRDVLLYSEKMLKMNDDGTMNYLTSSAFKIALSMYNLSEIKYTVLKLKEAGFLDVTITNADAFLVLDFRIYDITYDGHEFLDTIRDNDNWKKVKNIACNVGSFSISVLKQIAIGVIEAKLKTIIGDKANG